MSYIPYLIANFATGLEKKLQPWLNPDDSQEELYDGDVYRGTLSKRDGYVYFATGERGGFPYRESRIIHTLTGVVPAGAINSSNKTYTLAGQPQIARGSVTITGTTPSQSATDNGVGGFTLPVTGSVDYLTGAISVTFNTAPTAGTVLVTYSYMPGNPVMMVATYIDSNNTKKMIVADTQYVNIYNITGNILQDISPATAYTGTKSDFFTWVNYKDAASVPRLLFCNNVDVIQQYDGAVVTDYAYTSSTISTLTASYMVVFKDRLILLRTTEDGTIFPQRLRISGTGASCDSFDTTATGAGFIDIPDGTWIQGATFNRDDLLIFTEASVWVLKYTGNDTTPFVLQLVDGSRGSDATFSAFTYLNRSSAASKRGLIITDGYQVERQDVSIPDFTFNEVDQDMFKLCYSGVVDDDRDHYLIYPPQNQTPGEEISQRILVTNYDEDNYSIYRLPLSCMGTYSYAYDVSWNDLLVYENWAQFAAVYGNWNSFAFSKGTPFSVGGGHRGEIWKLAVSDPEGSSEDNIVKIRNITIIDDETIEVTTDWNNFSDNPDDPEMGADIIFLTGIEGMIQANNKQYAIIGTPPSQNVFQLKVPDTTAFSAYTTGGTAERVIPFSALFKQFNPFIGSDKKVRCGWLYLYVDSTGTRLTRNIDITDITISDEDNPAIVTTAINHNLQTGAQVAFNGVAGMTEINGEVSFVTVLTPNTFSITTDTSTFTPYVSGGYAETAENASMDIDIITNDNVQRTELNNPATNPYQANCTNMIFETGAKKWYKTYINQTGKFIQFRLRNAQAGANINVQATMPGFAPVGRLI